MPERPIPQSSISKQLVSITAKDEAHSSSNGSLGLRDSDSSTQQSPSEQGGSISGVAPS